MSPMGNIQVISERFFFMGYNSYYKCYMDYINHDRRSRFMGKVKIQPDTQDRLSFDKVLNIVIAFILIF